MDHVGWVKLYARETKDASNKDDAIARGSRVFDAFESSILAIASTGINQMVEQGKTLLTGTAECKELKLELQQLKQLVTQKSQNQIGRKTLKQIVELLQAAYVREQQLASHLEARTNELDQQLQQIQQSNSNQAQRFHAP
ncbi:uncharacterized protein LOC115953670 [Quercus lobata]|uniref:Uncharacterized protein n=1 Tax=Quercus lobata TaxID=97700 RepID=A0A7N2M7H2_QUELO|nr:uncharacterized protein LOC115953670 [Quercus lobata]XP_030927283.1 uncharacterized protein LOC115953670 [Quercus lobata]